MAGGGTNITEEIKLKGIQIALAWLSFAVLLILHVKLIFGVHNYWKYDITGSCAHIIQI